MGSADIVVETGTQASLYGDLTDIITVDGQTIYYPTGAYYIDGVFGESLDRNTASSGAYLVPHYSRFPTATD